MNDIFNFMSNSFVMTTKYEKMTFGKTEFIIPFYAVENIVQHDDNTVDVTLKKQLTRFDSFDKVLYKINEKQSFKIFFYDELEKQIFIENVNRFKSK